MNTIKQIADRCCVSEQAVRGWCRRNKVAKDAKGSYEISETIEADIYKYYKVDVAKDVAKDAKDKDELIWELKGRIERLELEKELEGKRLQEKTEIIQKELEAKNEQIIHLQKLLDQEQQLRMVTEQKLRLPEAEQEEETQNQQPEEEKETFWRRLWHKGN